MLIDINTFFSYKYTYEDKSITINTKDKEIKLITNNSKDNDAITNILDDNIDNNKNTDINIPNILIKRIEETIRKIPLIHSKN